MRSRNRLLLLTLISILMIANAGASPLLNASESCGEDGCPIPTLNEDNQPVYAIVSPVGYHAVKLIEQSERLDTLADKKIALVGGSFMASVTHDELKKCILERYPTAVVYMFEQVGSGGPYSVYGQSAQTIAFQNQLRKLGIDAVISGNCGCGLCTVKESGSSIAAEYIGVPSVTVGAPSFIAQIHSLGVSRGVPVLRAATYPGAFSSHSEDDLRKYTREMVWPQVEEALTAPINSSGIERYRTDGKRPYDEIIYTGTFEEVQEYCQVNGWSDGLPVVPPTDGAIREYLRFTAYQPGELLGVYAQAYRECTVYTVAANAVMAGVPKELTPICIALTQALGDAEWRRPLSSTHGWTPYAWLNGPLARQLGIDCGQGMISEEKNKALGRFMDLMMLNLGGYYVKENRMGSFGYLTPFTFSEDEEACRRVGWTPYHVTQGFELNENTVTAASALAWGNNVTPATDQAERVMRLMAFDITEKQQNGLGNTNPQVYRTVLLTEATASILSTKYTKKEALEDVLISEARRPLYMRAYANYWANTGSNQSNTFTFDDYYRRMTEDPQEQAAMTETPEWLKGITNAGQIETIATMLKGQTPLLIAGDSSRNKFMVLPGGGYVTIPIRLPDNWDELTAPLGYGPLSQYYLKNQQTADQNAAVSENEHSEDVSDSEQDRVNQYIDVPSQITDGEYRLVQSMQQMTEAGRICTTGTDAVSVWPYHADRPETIVMSGLFADAVNGLYPACSVSIDHGHLSGIILRPVPSRQKNSGSAVSLKPEIIERIPVTIAVVYKQSGRDGKASEDGALVIISTKLARFSVSLGGEIKTDANNTVHFLKVIDDQVTLNPKSPPDSAAKIGVVSREGAWRTLTFTKRDQRTIQIQYSSDGSIAE